MGAGTGFSQSAVGGITSITSVGTGISLVVAPDKVKSLIAGTNIAIVNNGNDVTINATADDITVVANYSALPAVGTVSGQFFWCSAAQGTKWLPGSLGGTYYSAGLYYSNGVSWEFLAVPYQATQAGVDAGVITDQFVTPSTLKNATITIPGLTSGTTTTNANLTGDVTSVGNSTTLAIVNGNVGSYTNASITVNGKGLITAASNGTAPVTSVTGTANQIASTGGVTPVISIVSSAILPGAPTIVTPGNSTQNIITTDATQTLSNKTFVAPALGTPVSGVGTNLTGTASGLTAGNVTTNANLTGDITSSGNATTLATVNSNVGAFTDATVTVNAKGLVTAAASGSAKLVAASNLSDLASAVTARTNLAAPFTLFFSTARGQGPADNSNYYFDFNETISTTDAYGMILPYDCTLIGASIMATNELTTATTEASTVYVRKNNTTEVQLSNAVLFSGTVPITNSYAVTGLSTSYVAGDKLSIHWLTATWATNPTGAKLAVVLYFIRN